MQNILLLLSEAISIPVLPFTALLGFILVYWISVILGFFQVESLDPEIEADLDIDAEIDVDMEVEAEIDAEFEADVDAEVEADADVESDVDIDGSAPSFAEFLNLGRIPFSVWLSIFTLSGWFMTMIANGLLDIVGEDFIHSAIRLLGGLIVFVPSSAITAKWMAVPLGKVLQTTKATRNSDLVNQICKITSSRVDEGFGTAEIQLDYAPVILYVRADASEKLKKGDKAVIVEYVKQQNIYQVTRFDEN
jgi:hypothetical protein